MARAGKNCVIRQLSATTAFGESTDLAATTSADDTIYQLASSSQQGMPWGSTGAITVADSSGGGGSAWGSTLYSVNRLNGSVVFTSSASRDVFLVGEWIDLSTATFGSTDSAQVAQAYEYSYTLSAGNVEDNVFLDDFISRVQLTKDVVGTFGMRYTTGNNDTYYNLLTTTSDMPVVMEFRSSSSGWDARCWALISGEDIAMAHDDVINDTISFEGTVDADDRVVTFSTAGTP